MACKIDKALEAIENVLKDNDIIKGTAEYEAIIASATVMLNNIDNDVYPSNIDTFLTQEVAEDKSVKEIIPEVNSVEVMSTKDKLDIMLSAYESNKGINVGGGYVENSVVDRDGINVSVTDEDVAAGSFVKGMVQESVKDMLPKLHGNTVSKFRKAYNAYYNEYNKSSGVRKIVEQMMSHLDIIEGEPTVAYELGLTTTLGSNAIDKQVYWTNAITNYLRGSTITIDSKKGNAYNVKVDKILLQSNMYVKMVASVKTKEYTYIVNPITGKALNGDFIGIFENIYDRIKFSNGSELNSVGDVSRFDTLVADLSNDITKAKELVAMLDEFDRVDISEKHSKHLDSVLETFIDKSKSFIPKLAIHLDTKAEKNGGKLVFSKTKGDLYVGIGSRDQQFAAEMSGKEVFAHEIIHAAVEFGREYHRADVAGIMTRVHSLQNKFFKEVTARDLMVENSPYGDEVELENAEKLYKYLQSTNGVAEFIAHGLTNERVIAKLQEIDVYDAKTKTSGTLAEKLWSYVVALYEYIFSGIRSERGITGDQLLMKLSLKLAESNNKAVNRVKAGFIARGTDSVNAVNKAINIASAKLVDKLVSQGTIAMPKSTATNKDNVLFVVKNFGALAFNKNSRGAFEGWLSSTFEYLGKPEGTLQTVIRGFRDSDSLQKAVETLGLASTKIDQQRQEIESAVIKQVLEGFKEKPSNTDLVNLGLGVVETDLSVLANDPSWTNKNIEEIFSDNTKLLAAISTEINTLKRVASSKTDSNYFINQAMGLGRFMVTGQGNETTLLNAKNIAMKLNDNIIEADAEVEAAVDKLATLYAVKFLEPNVRDAVAKLMAKDFKGVKGVMAHQQGFKLRSVDVLGERQLNAVKGYSKDILDKDITIRVAPVTDRAKMEEAGFKLHKVLEKNRYDTSSVKYGMYISENHTQQNFNRAGMRLTDRGRMGTTVSDIHRAEDGIYGREKASLEIESIEMEARNLIALQHTRILEEDKMLYGRVPIMNYDGKALDYRYTMSKVEKAQLLKRDVRATVILGRMFASVYDKVQTETFNDDIIKVALKDMEDNYTGAKFGRNMKEYVVVSPYADEESIKELWKLMPDTMRKHISFTTGKQEIAVRRDLLNSYFGYRDASLSDSSLMKLGGRITTDNIRLAERIMKDLVGISKMSVVIKTPAVLLGNIISNFTLSIQLGMNPIDVAKFQFEGVQELTNYRNWVKELAQLKVARSSGNVSKLNLDRIAFIEGKMAKSPVKDLMDRGLFSTIIEDMPGDTVSTSNKTAKKVTDFLEDKPKWIRIGVETLYVSEQSSIFKAMLTATQYSDFVARYGLYTSYRLKGMGKENALQRVTDAFINYDIPDSAALKYMNDMGLVMFTKYFLRIQKVIRTGVQEKPLSFLLALLAQEYILGDTDDVIDQSIFAKNYSGIVHTPIEHFYNIVMPSTIEVVASAL